MPLTLLVIRSNATVWTVKRKPRFLGVYARVLFFHLSHAWSLSVVISIWRAWVQGSGVTFENLWSTIFRHVQFLTTLVPQQYLLIGPLTHCIVSGLFFSRYVGSVACIYIVYRCQLFQDIANIALVLVILQLLSDHAIRLIGSLKYGWKFNNFPAYTPLPQEEYHEQQWASYQIRKIAGWACAGNAGNVFPRHRLQRKPLVV